MSNDALFADLDSLLDASMDDLDDLPPVGVPPSGHYNLTMTIEPKTIGEGEQQKEVLAASYVVDAINELKDEDERSEVQLGQQFTEFFHLTKKDGTKNVFGIGTLKERLKPMAERSGTTNVGELVRECKQIQIAATLVRKVNKKNEDQYNMNLRDIVLL